MKKLLAYISIAVTAVVALAVGVVPTILNINGNIDYARSREYVFQIGDRIVDSGADSDGTINERFNSLNDEDKKTESDEIINTFKDRLNSAQINEYKLETDGYDKIKITFKTSQSLYGDISSLLNFNWSFMASTYGQETNSILGNDAQTVYNSYDSGKFDSLENNFFKPGDARVEYRNGYPYVVIALENPDEFKKLYDISKKVDSTDTGTETESLATPILKADEDGDGVEDEVTANKNKIFILNDWLTGFKLEDLLTNKGTDNLKAENVKDHVLFALDATKPESFYWDYNANDDQEKTTYKEIFFGGYDLLDSSEASSYYGTLRTSQDDVTYKKATSWMNKFNSTPFKYNISLLNYGGTESFENSVAPQIEYLSYMDKVTLSTLLIATLVAMVIVTLFFILNYGLNGIMGAISFLTIGIVSLALFNALGIEFNIGAILGLLTVMCLGIFSSSGLFRKIKNEIYLGKNFKKSFQDGSKKGLWYTLDAFFIGIICGVITYLIPNSICLSFGSIMIVGACLNLLVNGLGLRILTWILYTSNFVSKRPALVSSEPKLIPNLQKDEKPKYFEAFKTKTSKSSKKVYGIIAGVLLVASIVGLTTFQSLNGNIYNSSTNATTSMVYVEKEESGDFTRIDNQVSNNETNLETLITNDISSTSDGKTKLIANVDVNSYYYSYKTGNSERRKYFYTVDLNKIYDSSTSYYYTLNDTDWIEGNFETCLFNVIQTMGDSFIPSVEETYNVEDDTNNLYVLIYYAIALGVVGLYFAFRFGISRALSSFVLIGGSLVVIIGIFSLIRGPFTSIITLGILFLLTFAYLIADSYFLGEKEIYNENRKLLKDNFALREEKFNFANNVTYQGVFTPILLSAFAILSMFFASGVDSMMLTLILFGMLLIVLFMKVLSLPLELTFNKCFIWIKSKINFKPRKSKTSGATPENEGPEEATFIGIND